MEPISEEEFRQMFGEGYDDLEASSKKGLEEGLQGMVSDSLPDVFDGDVNIVGVQGGHHDGSSGRDIRLEDLEDGDIISDDDNIIL